MPFISVNGLSILASFDDSFDLSLLPNTAMDYLQAISPAPFLVTAPTPRGTFSTPLNFLRSEGPMAMLGLDWFAFVREFYIAQGETPPAANTFSLNSTGKFLTLCLCIFADAHPSCSSQWNTLVCIC